MFMHVLFQYHMGFGEFPPDSPLITLQLVRQSKLVVAADGCPLLSWCSRQHRSDISIVHCLLSFVTVGCPQRHFWASLVHLHEFVQCWTRCCLILYLVELPQTAQTNRVSSSTGSITAQIQANVQTKPKNAAADSQM